MLATNSPLDLPKLLVVECGFYSHIAELQWQGALARAQALQVLCHKVTVAGALEAPLAVSWGADTGRFNGFVVLGCVIRGATSHYDVVVNESARGLMQLMVQRGLALTNGIITAENEVQALERADVRKKDKGGAAVAACVNLLKLKQHLWE